MIDTTPKRFIIALLAMCTVSFLLGMSRALLPEMEIDLDYMAGFISAYLFIFIAKKP